jgi:hypothetical protein
MRALAMGAGRPFARGLSRLRRALVETLGIPGFYPPPSGVDPAHWRRRSHFRYFVSGRHIRQRRKSNSPRATIPNAVPIASAGLLADKFAQPHSARIVFAVAALRLRVRSLIGVRAIFSRICRAHDPKFARRLCISAERWRFTKTVRTTAAAINPTLTTTTHPNLPTQESSHSCTDARSACLTKRWRKRALCPLSLLGCRVRGMLDRVRCESLANGVAVTVVAEERDELQPGPVVAARLLVVAYPEVALGQVQVE